jgi:group I intron endonuclease
MKSGIYKITNTTNGKVYIGSAVSLVKRWRCHLSTLKSNTHRNDKLQKSFNLHGENNFVFSVILECSVQDLIIYEQALIDYHNAVKNGYNISPIAGSGLGRFHKEETKEKMKRAWELRRLKPKKPVSEEAKRKISESKLGKKRKPFTEEAKKNMSISRMGNKNRLGIPHTEETKAKMKLTRLLKKENKK